MARHFVFHKSLSLNAIPRIKAVDVFLIDGDHNWYTVYNELKLIEKHAADAERFFPRGHAPRYRVALRAPGSVLQSGKRYPISSGSRIGKKGCCPGRRSFLKKVWLNQHLNNSIYENDLQNGVLTAVRGFPQRN